MVASPSIAASLLSPGLPAEPAGATVCAEPAGATVLRERKAVRRAGEGTVAAVGRRGEERAESVLRDPSSSALSLPTTMHRPNGRSRVRHIAREGVEKGGRYSMCFVDRRKLRKLQKWRLLIDIASDLACC